MNAAKTKFIIAIITMAVILCSFVFGTLAYFTDSVNSGDAIVIETGEIKTELTNLTLSEDGDDLGSGAIPILPGYELAKELRVKSTGNIPIYVRVKITLDIRLHDAYLDRASEIDPSLVTLSLDESDWFYDGGYYYFRDVLYEGDSTTSLISSVAFSPAMGNMYQESTLNLGIRMEAVQASMSTTGPLDAPGWDEAVSEGGGV